MMGNPSMPQPENRPAQKSSPFVHLISASIALVMLVGAVIFSERRAASLEDQYVHALAPMELEQAISGIVIQQAAFRQADLLPVYGSSEMLYGDTPYEDSIFFASYPTGFNVIDIAKGGVTSLNLAQTMAALGPELSGRKVVISFTPIMFEVGEVSNYAYAGNFSRLHAASLAFNPTLGMAVKQQAAKRMLEYPDTLSQSDDRLLAFALQNLAGGTAYNQIVYALSWPLGQLDTLIIRLQDHYAVWSLLQNTPNIDQVANRQRRSIDWDAEIDKGEAQQKANSNTNPYGIDNKAWVEEYQQVLKINQPGSGDQKYINKINISEEWGDLAIMLEILKELGAQPLIMSRPINGTLYAAAGISEQAQQTYYTRLQSLVSAYNMPLVDFQQYTNDRYFSFDEASHTGAKGWVIVDRTLDAFYHGNIR
jgi:D-alanine transfer protein